MSSRNLIVSMMLSIALAFSVAAAASATTRYNYMGNNFTFAKRLITAAMSLSGSIEMASPLPPGLSNVDLTPSLLSFSMTDGVRVLTQSSSLSYVEFRVSTDALGNIQ